MKMRPKNPENPQKEEEVNEMRETIEMLDKTLQEKNIRADDKEKLEDIAKALIDSEEEESELDQLNIEELSDILTKLDNDYQKTPIQDARITEKVKEELKDEAEYVAEFYSADVDYYDLKSKEEVKEHLQYLVAEEICHLEHESNDTDTFEALSQVFGSETLASTHLTSDNERVKIELEKINTLDRHYITVEDQRFEAIRL